MTAADHHFVAAAGDRFALQYADGIARVEDVDLRRIAREVGTPTYVYSAEHMAHRYRDLALAVGARPTLICYAAKANSAQAVLRHFARMGAGADIVSGGELARALQAGIPADRIVFSGVGKRDEEIDAAILAGVRSINLESRGELEQIAARAAALSKTACVSLRVNPDVDPDTHPYLATGLREAKFGISMAEAAGIAASAHARPGIELVGLACHIGSQIFDESPFLDSLARLRSIIDELQTQGVTMRQLDLGGGLAIAYGRDDDPLDVAAWGRALTEATADLDLELVLEPGRYLVGNAGVLLTRVLGRKQGEEREFVIVDAAMNDLLRPALYDAYHAIVPVQLPGPDVPTRTVDIVGPVCECGDFLAQRRPLQGGECGELLAVLSAGAYGMAMASTYNTRPLPAEVMVNGDALAVLRPRKTVEDLIAEERYPEWLRQPK